METAAVPESADFRRRLGRTSRRWRSLFSRMWSVRAELISYQAPRTSWQVIDTDEDEDRSRGRSRDSESVSHDFTDWVAVSSEKRYSGDLDDEANSGFSSEGPFRWVSSFGMTMWTILGKALARFRQGPVDQELLPASGMHRLQLGLNIHHKVS